MKNQSLLKTNYDLEFAIWCKLFLNLESGIRFFELFGVLEVQTSYKGNFPELKYIKYYDIKVGYN